MIVGEHRALPGGTAHAQRYQQKGRFHAAQKARVPPLRLASR